MTAAPQLARTRRSSTSIRVVRFADGTAGSVPDQVVVEEPLRVWVQAGHDRQVLGTTMRTPGDDIDLAVGLAVAEGAIVSREDLVQVRPCARDEQVDAVTVHLRPDAGLPAQSERVGTVSSACGVCGHEAIETVLARPHASHATGAVDAALVASLAEQMSAGQRLFRRTGGLHAAALADACGVVHTVREDVGRHNAVDKVIGASLLSGAAGSMLMVSGRAGFEIVQKAVVAGVSVVASVSAPTSLAVDLARCSGIVLAGFVRGGSMNIYSGSELVQLVHG